MAWIAPLALVAALSSHASEPPKLWAFDSLQAAISAPDRVRILDVRPRVDYDKGHVPGATWADVKAAEALAARPGGLQDAAGWQSWAASLGLPRDADIVVYGQNRQLDAARVWWLLTYLGADRVGLLDGNFSAWAKAGMPTSAEVSKVGPSTFAVALRKDRLATREDVASLLKTPGQARVIDARTSGEHLGTVKRSSKAGRIPAACHLEWSDLVDADGHFLGDAALREKVAKAGIASDEAVVTHCQGGGRASVDAFVFERLGHRTRNYYLGWSDWGNAEGMPVETGAPKKP